jgi:cyclophilin family peptidyl-prolyl cis-trans isomerase
MANKRTRDRQLAKLAARRHDERAAAKRRRDITLGIVGAIVAVVLIVGGLRLLRDDDPAVDASATVSPSAVPAGTPQVTGEVTPQAEPPAEVACGAEAPAAAGEPKPQFDRAPGIDMLDPDVGYRATIETSCGTIVVDLDASRAPQAVSSFVFLAREGFFDGLTFHRVAPGFVIQGGDPLGTGSGGPGYAFPDELTGRLRYTEGTLAMANSGPNTNGSQWFIVSGPDGANLDELPNYTIFGGVAEGADVVAAIDAVPVDGEAPSEAVFIDSITIRERELRAEPSDGAAPSEASPSETGAATP